MNPKFLEAIIVGVALAHAVIVALASLYSIWRFRVVPTRVQIASLAVSHCILTALVATGLIRYWSDAWWINNFRTPLALVAFGLTVYGLFNLIHWASGNGEAER